MTMRVRVRDYGVILAGDPRLVPVPSVRKPPCLLHHKAAAALVELEQAWRATDPTRCRMLVASGWRPHRWPSREAYEAELVRRYGSVAAGRIYLAYDSPHETGLAVDLCCGGLMPVSATAAMQRRTPLYRWLRERAREHDWFPYEPEPWHWELPISRDAWDSLPRATQSV